MSRFLSVLLVDDEDEIREVITGLLANWRPEIGVQQASSGEAALKSLRGSKVDLVICDLKMPGMDGYELCAAIRADPCRRDTKFLAITGEVFQEVRDRIMQAGADDLLEKPFEFTELQSRIRALLPGIESAK